MACNSCGSAGSNPFAGLITEAVHQLYTDGIDALLEQGACTVPCRVSYGITKWTECPNCIFNPNTKRSSNKYKSGGSIPFNTGICPYCKGEGRLPDSQTDTIYLLPVWNYKEWMPISSVHKILLQTPEGYVQTLSKMATIATLKRAKDIIIDTNIEDHVRQKFTRYGEPEPCGLGRSSYIATMWQKVD